MKHTLFFAVIMALILVAGASAQDLEKAKQEGRLVFYTSWGLSDADYVIKAFEKKYPFLKIELARSTSEKTLGASYGFAFSPAPAAVLRGASHSARVCPAWNSGIERPVAARASANCGTFSKV